MKLSQQFNSHITSLVDTYRGAVPLARLLLEAHRLTTGVVPATPLDLGIYTDAFGDTFLEVTFEDGSTVTLAVGEEM